MSIMPFYRTTFTPRRRRPSSEKPKTVWRRGLLTPNGRLGGTGVPTWRRRVQHVCHGVLRPVPYIIYKYNIFYTHNIVINYLSPWCGVFACALFSVRVCVRASFQELRLWSVCSVPCYRLSRSHQSSVTIFFFLFLLLLIFVK